MTMNKSKIPLQVESAWECCWDRLINAMSDVFVFAIKSLKQFLFFSHRGGANMQT